MRNHPLTPLQGGILISVFLCTFLISFSSESKQENYKLVFDKYNYWQKNQRKKEAFYIVCEGGYLASPRLYDLKNAYDYYSKCKNYQPLDYLAEFQTDLTPEQKTYPAYPVILGQKLFFLCDGFFSNNSKCPVSKKQVIKDAGQIIEALDFSEF